MDEEYNESADTIDTSPDIESSDVDPSDTDAVDIPEDTEPDDFDSDDSSPDTEPSDVDPGDTDAVDTPEDTESDDFDSDDSSLDTEPSDVDSGDTDAVDIPEDTEPDDFDSDDSSLDTEPSDVDPGDTDAVDTPEDTEPDNFDSDDSSPDTEPSDVDPGDTDAVDTPEDTEPEEETEGSGDTPEEQPEEKIKEREGRDKPALFGKFAEKKYDPQEGFAVEVGQARDNGCIDDNNNVKDGEKIKEIYAFPSGSDPKFFNESTAGYDTHNVYKSKVAPTKEILGDGSVIIHEGGAEQVFLVPKEGEIQTKYDNNNFQPQPDKMGWDEVMNDDEAWESVNTENAMYDDLTKTERGKSTEEFYKITNAGNRWRR